MDRSTILQLAVVTVLLAVIATVSADETKHKRVIVKVPKKINHIHHHHVQKIHVYKHKPKPIHSIHVVEEDEPIGKGWKNIFQGKHIKHSRHKGSFGGGWKHDERYEEEYGYGGDDEEEEEEDEGYHKSESHNEPTIWRGKKTSGKWNAHHAGGGKGKTSGRSNWKGDRSKRQKNHGAIYRPEPSSHKSHSQKKPKKSSRTPKSKKSKKTRPYRPIDKGYSDYSEYYDDGHYNDSPIWPERKEHISWHMRERPWYQRPVVPLVTESPHLVLEDYRTEHKGEINLAKPEIQEVKAPMLGPNHAIQDPHYWAKEVAQKPQLWTKEVAQTPQLWTKEVVQKPKVWPKEIIQEHPQLWTKEVLQEPQVWSKPIDQEPQVWMKPIIQEPQLWLNSDIQEQQFLTESIAQEPQIKVKPVTQVPKKTSPKKKATDRPQIRKPVIQQEHKEVHPMRPEGYRTEVEHSGSGYTSHVGHTAEGDSASFQSVRFGDKIRNR